MRFLPPVLVALLSALFPVAAAQSQSVLVVWGDSIAAGVGADAATGTPWGSEPFGDPIPGVHRWDPVLQDWGPMTAYQNYTGKGADPAYGFAAGYQRASGTDEVWVVALSAPGSDVSADHPNPAGSWHPSIEDGLFAILRDDHLGPALASLPSPTVQAVLFTAGNNVITPSFADDVEEINAAIVEHAPASTPTYLGIKTYLGTALDPQVLLQRSAIELWATRSETFVVVDSTTVPARTGGFADGVHLTHFGAIFLGVMAAITERYGV